jgi:hypothetical protein
MPTKRELLNKIMTEMIEYIQSQNIPNLPALEKMRENIDLKQIIGLYKKFIFPLTSEPDLLKKYIEREIIVYSIIYTDHPIDKFELADQQMDKILYYADQINKIIS